MPIVIHGGDVAQFLGITAVNRRYVRIAATPMILLFTAFLAMKLGSD
jgi:hypothetical protein